MSDPALWRITISWQLTAANSHNCLEHAARVSSLDHPDDSTQLEAMLSVYMIILAGWIAQQLARV